MRRLCAANHGWADCSGTTISPRREAGVTIRGSPIDNCALVSTHNTFRCLSVRLDPLPDDIQPLPHLPQPPQQARFRYDIVSEQEGELHGTRLLRDQHESRLCVAVSTEPQRARNPVFAIGLNIGTIRSPSALRASHWNQVAKDVSTARTSAP